jgi:hypothetical protein
VFPKLQEVTIILAVAIRMEQLAPTGRIFMKFDIDENLLRKCKFN